LELNFKDSLHTAIMVILDPIYLKDQIDHVALLLKSNKDVFIFDAVYENVTIEKNRLLKGFRECN